MVEIEKYDEEEKREENGEVKRVMQIPLDFFARKMTRSV